MKTYKVIGLMSGTSLDGLDIVYCTLKNNNGKWTYKLNHSTTYNYSKKLKSYLQHLEHATARGLAQAHMDFGTFLGQQVNKFIEDNNISPQLISSHGHTVFHEPGKSYTFQLGAGSSISAITGMKVISDFRAQDVALGGEGAPLVPIGDELLFAKYDYCLNLGGIANISYQRNKKRVAFDICPVNIVLNSYANRLGKNYDNKGMFAKQGTVDAKLLSNLNKLGYYRKAKHKPKSLGNEWVEKSVLPLFKGVQARNVLATYTEHVATQIAKVVDEGKNVLVTGGGAYNEYLMERVKELSNANYIIPEPDLVEYKEAIIFSLLGVLRLEGENNTLSSVTGANKDSSGGSVTI